jgi:hypothetical protein
MNRLERLHEKLEAIPSKRKRSTLVNALAQHSSRTARASATLSQSLESETHVRTLFPDLAAGSAEENRAKARRIALRLKKRLAADIHAVENTKTDSDVADLAEYASKAEESVRNRWRSALTAKLQGYEALVKAASDLGLSKDRTPVITLAHLQGQTDPPATREAANAIQDSMERLTRSVAELGLEGEAGEFLVAAANGRGDPRALQRQVVRDFLEQRNLWHLLVVKFQ